MSHQSRIRQLLQEFPQDLQESLAGSVGADRFRGILAPDVATSIAKKMGCSIDTLMVALLPIAALYARPPISNYPVGAIAQDLRGTLYFGGNIEFEGLALGATIHAEQTAVVHAWLHGAEGVRTLAVNQEPCGHCRQFLNELSTAAELRILLPDRAPTRLEKLLPSAFGPQSLNNPDGFMTRVNHGLNLPSITDDALIQAALDAANRSYAPYSGNFAGAAVRLAGGEIFAAPYAENAAFNPSLSPLHAVLMQMHICDKPFAGIQRALLVERESLCSQAAAAQALLASMLESKIALEVHLVR